MPIGQRRVRGARICAAAAGPLQPTSSRSARPSDRGSASAMTSWRAGAIGYRADPSATALNVTREPLGALDCVATEQTLRSF